MESQYPLQKQTELNGSYYQFTFDTEHRIAKMVQRQSTYSQIKRITLTKRINHLLGQKQLRVSLALDPNDRILLLSCAGFMWDSIMLSLVAISQRYEVYLQDVVECFSHFGSIDQLVEIYEGETQNQQNARL